MQSKHDNGNRPHEESRKKPGLLARARARTEQEHGLSLSAETAHYTTALGQPPYVALGNGGIIVVQRRCGGWNC